MPSSRPDHIPLVISLVRQLRPRSILELGVGFGKWGHLFREYTDIVMAETDPARYQRENWQVRIDGIEGHPPYLTPAHQYLYNQLLLGDMRELIHQVGVYDLIFLGDAIEHVEKADGLRLLRATLEHVRLAVIVTTPARPTGQQAACGNPLEIHRSFWTPTDFHTLGRCLTKIAAGDTLIAVLLKPGVAAPRLALRRRGSLWARVYGRGAHAAAGG